MQRIVAAAVVLMSSAWPCYALVSTNVPLDHWSYDAVEKLAGYGLIDSAMLTVKPLSRVEMARHIAQAMYRLKHAEDPPAVLSAIVERLQREFAGELILLGAAEGWYGQSFIKPVEDPYVKYLYARREPDLENVRGDEFREGSNYRAGFASRIKLYERFAFYLHPEWSDSSREDADIELIEGYGKAMAGPIEVELGRDSLWWGPSHHGSILMSNNAEPFTMIKVTNPQPIQLPWLLRGLGPVKAQWFMTELEEDRAIPEAKLSGVRVNIRPHPCAEFGASRVIMFGGRGVPRVDLFDYAKMFLARSEQAENNQIAGFDGSFLVPLEGNPLMRSIGVYVEAAGEDEAAGWPSKWAYLLGFRVNDVLRTGRTDLRVEYADTHEVFYRHSLYTSGYTYEDRVIGHHVGPDSQDLFVQLSHYLSDDLVLDVSYDRQVHDVSRAVQPTVSIFECGVMFFPSSNWQVRAGYRHENGGEGRDDDHIVQLQLIREF